MKFKFLKKLANRNKKTKKIFYICDKRACGNDCECLKCIHTSDITHAKNFKCVGGAFYEETTKDLRKLARKINHNLTNL